MAAESLIGEFCSETTCPICLEYFKDPVTVDCGHNFCQACLTQYWRETGTIASCPHCRQRIQQRNFRPNQQLSNLVELVKKLQERNEEGKRGVCETHQEPLKLFCKEEQVPICVVCDRSKEHREHSVFPIEEASQVYKGKITDFLETLKKTREKLVDWKTSEELGRQEGLKQGEIENEKVRCAFERMQKVLGEKQYFWLTLLKEMEKEIEKKQEEDITKLSVKISQLSQLITEMEGKCQQPASEFLQDIRNTLCRYGKHLAQHEVDLSPNVEDRLRILSLKKSVLQKAVENYKESLEQVLNPSKLEQTLKAADSLTQAMNKVNVILDVHTAHPLLTVSEDMKNVKLGSKKKSEWWKKNMLDNPARFDWDPCVLGCEKLIAGIHWWVVEVSGTGSWAVGVSVDLVRKGNTRLNPEEGIWAMGKPYQDTYSPYDVLALTFPEPILLRLSKDLKKILVILDYDGGRVDFFDADTNGLIFTFYAQTFCGESIRPFFQVRECGLSLMC